MKALMGIGIFLVSSWAMASGLMINATEYSVGKFHRYDNKLHHYSPQNVWADHIMPDNAPASTPIVFENADQSVTIQFSSLEELLTTAVQVAKSKDTKISVLNINGHGMPGGMWYPKDAAQRDSLECADWRASAAAPDESNYNDYYTPETKDEIMALRATADYPAHYACVTGASEWKEVVARIPDIKNYFADDAQIHFESCLVGLGPVGENFTVTVASLLLHGSRAAVEATTDYGLGDWSIPEGMGFWDYQNDTQLARDNQIYPIDHKDREIMQKGVIRITRLVNGAWRSGLATSRQFMLVGPGQLEVPMTPSATILRPFQMRGFGNSRLAPALHVPGTHRYAQRLN